MDQIEKIVANQLKREPVDVFLDQFKNELSQLFQIGKENEQEKLLLKFISKFRKVLLACKQLSKDQDPLSVLELFQSLFTAVRYNIFSSQQEEKQEKDIESSKTFNQMEEFYKFHLTNALKKFQSNENNFIVDLSFTQQIMSSFQQTLQNAQKEQEPEVAIAAFLEQFKKTFEFSIENTQHGSLLKFLEKALQLYGQITNKNAEKIKKSAIQSFEEIFGTVLSNCSVEWQMAKNGDQSDPTAVALQEFKMTLQNQLQQLEVPKLKEQLKKDLIGALNNISVDECCKQFMLLIQKEQQVLKNKNNDTFGNKVNGPEWNYLLLVSQYVCQAECKYITAISSLLVIQKNLKGSYYELEFSKETLKKQVKILEERTRLLNETVQEKKIAVKLLTEQKEELEKKIEIQKSNLEKVNKALQKAEGETQNLEKQKQELESNIEKLKKQKEDLDEKLIETKVELGISKKEVVRVTEENNTLKLQIELYKKKRNSTASMPNNENGIESLGVYKIIQRSENNGKAIKLFISAQKTGLDEKESQELLNFLIQVVTNIEDKIKKENYATLITQAYFGKTGNTTHAPYLKLPLCCKEYINSKGFLNALILGKLSMPVIDENVDSNILFVKKNEIN